MNRQKVFPSFCVIFLFFRTKLFTVALRFSAEILSLFTVSEWVLGIRGLFLIILLNHLPQEIQILHLFGVIRTSLAFSLLGYISDASHFSISSISTVRISSSKNPPANTACLRKILQIIVHSEFFPSARRFWTISQIVIAFHRIRTPLNIRSILQ